MLHTQLDELRPGSAAGADLNAELDASAREPVMESPHQLESDQARPLGKLVNLGQVLGNARDTTAVSQALAEFAVAVTPSNALLLSQSNPERQEWVPIYAWSDGSRVDLSAGSPRAMGNIPHFRALSRGEIIVSHDPSAGLALDLGAPPPRSLLDLPLQVGGRVIGALELHSAEPNAFGAEQVNLLKLAANLAALAIENLRLRESEQASQAALATAPAAVGERELTDDLRKAKEDLEMRVAERTAELRSANERLERELSERKLAEAALRDSEERFRSVFAALAEGIVLQDANGTIFACNTAAERILGLGASELLGHNSIYPHWRTIHADGSPFTADMHPAMVTLRIGEPQVNVIMGIHKPDRTLTWISINSQPLLRPGEYKPFGVAVSFSDITSRKRAEDNLRELSMHDALTGLYNRHHFETEMVMLDRGEHFPVSILVADVDGLKSLNDSQGHAAGDELLRQTARLLQATFRAQDIVARVGGDEFAVLMPETDQAAARRAESRLRHRLEAYNAESNIPVSLSIGVATVERRESLDSALRRADARMYEDKVMHGRSTRR